jgi:hypothetical protein
MIQTGANSKYLDEIKVDADGWVKIDTVDKGWVMVQVNQGE